MFAEARVLSVEGTAVLTGRFTGKTLGALEVDETDRKDDRPPPVVEQDHPEHELEEKVRRHPGNKEAKVDLGSDESMDASDPLSVVQPQGEEPVPSSGFPEDDE
jgi:hypothetical protein